MIVRHLTHSYKYNHLVTHSLVQGMLAEHLSTGWGDAGGKIMIKFLLSLQGAHR